ncbi:mevalonate kinase, partial [Kipferlia bialata]
CLDMVPSSPLCHVLITIHSDCPLGAGLGSSAAVSLVIAAGLYTAFHAESESETDTDTAHDEADSDVPLPQVHEGVTNTNSASSAPMPVDVSVIRSIADAGEASVHGTPSGIDTSTILLGGTLSFQRQSDGTMHTQSMDMPVGMCLRILNSGQPKNTGEMVAMVRGLRATPSGLSALGAIDTLCAEIVESSLNGTLTIPQVVSAIRVNQTHLSALHLCTPAVDTALSTLSPHVLGGAVKITGAGGGGCVLGVTQRGAGGGGCVLGVTDTSATTDSDGTDSGSGTGVSVGYSVQTGVEGLTVRRET